MKYFNTKSFAAILYSGILFFNGYSQKHDSSVHYIAESKKQIKVNPTYLANCARCHGFDARGNGFCVINLETGEFLGYRAKPSNLTKSSLIEKKNYAGLQAIVKSGIKRDGQEIMPAFNLSENEIKDIGKYIRSIKDPSKKEFDPHANHKH